MLTFLLIVVIAVFVVSYFRFIRKHAMRLKLLEYIKLKHQMNPEDVLTALSLCTAYTNAQLYKSAYDKYDEILHSNNIYALLSHIQMERVMRNQEFCKAPFIGSSGPKDRHFFKYAHYFLLNRIGRERYSFLRDEDLLEFNSILRNS